MRHIFYLIKLFIFHLKCYIIIWPAITISDWKQWCHNFHIINLQLHILYSCPESVLHTPDSVIFPGAWKFFLIHCKCNFHCLRCFYLKKIMFSFFYQCRNLSFPWQDAVKTKFLFVYIIVHIRVLFSIVQQVCHCCADLLDDIQYLYLKFENGQIFYSVLVCPSGAVSVITNSNVFRSAFSFA